MLKRLVVFIQEGSLRWYLLLFWVLCCQSVHSYSFSAGNVISRVAIESRDISGHPSRAMRTATTETLMDPDAERRERREVTLLSIMVLRSSLFSRVRTNIVTASLT